MKRFTCDAICFARETNLMSREELNCQQVAEKTMSSLLDQEKRKRHSINDIFRYEEVITVCEALKAIYETRPDMKVVDALDSFAASI